MTISRGQMKRQLQRGGGIMNLSKEGIGGGSIKGVDMGSRVGFFNPFKSAKKAVKKVTKGVKGILSSDLGKAALLYAGTAGLGSLAAGRGFGSLMQLGTYAPSTVLSNLGTAGTNFFKGKAMGVDKFDNIVRDQSGLSKVLSSIGLGGDKGTGMGNIGKLATLGAVSSFLTSSLGMSPEQAEEEVTRDPSKYLELYYRNLNPPTADTNSEEYEAQVRDFVTTNTSEYAVGGRVGFENGSDDSAYMQDFSFSGQEKAEEFLRILEDARKAEEERKRDKIQEMYRQFMLRTQPMEVAEGGRIGFANGPVLPPDTTQPVNPFGPKPGDFGIEEDIPIKMASNIENDKILEALFEKYLDMGLSPKDAAEAAQKEFERMSMMKTEGRGLAAIGGRMDTASDNAMQAAGIEGLPLRQNPKGVKELDLRDSGGFIPPVGIKEKEDDIPAMLSNNEFVFTADAVRGAGGGNVNLGAQRMYDMMKTLEAGGRV